jgi:hypothetical protein
MCRAFGPIFGGLASGHIDQEEGKGVQNRIFREDVPI